MPGLAAAFSIKGWIESQDYKSALSLLIGVNTGAWFFHAAIWRSNDERRVLQALIQIGCIV